MNLTQSILDFLTFDVPTDKQKTVLIALQGFVSSGSREDFFILRGAAGTGKTSIVTALVGYLNAIRIEYRIAAPTGRAARIIGRKAKSTASTVHSMIYIPKYDKDTGEIHYKLRLGCNSQPIVYIIDEASMIGVRAGASVSKPEKGLLFDLICFVKAANVNNKIIFLGDDYQLPPIGECYSAALNKGFLEETFNIKGTSHALTEVKRQTDGSYILQNATEIRRAIDRGEQTYPLNGSQNKSIYKAADSYVGTIKKHGYENAVCIAVSNKANDFFNSLARERMFRCAKKIVQVDELLIVTENWHRNGAQLYNGDHVKLESVDWNLQEEVAGLHFVAVKVKLLSQHNEITVDDYLLLESIMSPGGRIDAIKENELRRQRYIKNKIFRNSGVSSDDRYLGALRLAYGYAITCHKAQGGEWEKVFINTRRIPSLKWQYTAITRGIREIEKF